MTWSLPNSDKFYKHCSVFGLIIMLGPTSALICLLVYTTDMFEKVESGTTNLMIDTRNQKRLNKLTEKNHSESALIKEREKLIRERTANTVALKQNLTKQEVNLEKAQTSLRYAKITFFPTIILYIAGAALTFFGYRNKKKILLSKD